ncbi:hypothetical protein TSUD_70870 [Trifolium subterraneum]|uniref:Uncharacterized protein n=1 Tax=Trifolium subterraneum TaxID=3900 RepID=A0A2Z6LZB1_TRISU|nr:hypothetical protein TSUD_70870 [Trifolium subterraneum]
MASSPSPDIYIPDQWTKAANFIISSSTPPITLICGPANSGKATFSRYLLNVLFTKCDKVAYLDTNVGQPEFTPPGFVSLTILHNLTLDMTIPCLKTPERSLFFGDVSSQKDPSTYLKYIRSIYDYYRKEYCTFDKGRNSSMIQIPLVVNTSGWVKVKIGISTENMNLPAGKFWLDGKHYGTVQLIEIRTARQDSLNGSVLVQNNARLMRDLRLMAYFRQCLPSDSNISTIKELAHSLTTHCPYHVPIASVKIRHVHHKVPSSQIFHSLNASIVGLAVESGGPGNLPWCLGLGRHCAGR